MYEFFSLFFFNKQKNYKLLSTDTLDSLYKYELLSTDTFSNKMYFRKIFRYRYR